MTTPVPAATTTVGRLRAATADKVTRMPVMPAPVVGVTMTPTGDGPAAAASAGRRIAAMITAAEAIVAATSGVIAVPVVRVTTGRTEGATGRTAVTIGVVATATVHGGTCPSRTAVNAVVTIDVVPTIAVRAPTVGTVGHRAGAAVRVVSAPHVAATERPRSAGILGRTSRICPTMSKRRSWIRRSDAIF